MKKYFMIALTGLTLLVTSCGTYTGNGTLIGAGGGAALGAGIGALIGGGKRAVVAVVVTED